VPPSKDENRPKRNQSLRQKTGMKSGSQKWHKRTNLYMTEILDEIIKPFPNYCSNVWNDFWETQRQTGETLPTPILHRMSMF